MKVVPSSNGSIKLIPETDFEEKFLKAQVPSLYVISYEPKDKSITFRLKK